MDIDIRAYQLSDIEFISNGSEKIQDYVVKLDPIKRLRRQPGYTEYFIKELFLNIKEKEGQIYIAEKDNKPIGFIAGFINKQSKDNLLEVIPTKLGVISDVFVEKDFRNQGVGTLLISKMENYLKQKGCDSIWINIAAFNTNAHSLYKKHGYGDREIGLIKKIEKN